MNKKSLLILPLLGALALPGTASGQTIIKLTPAQREKIELTPALAKELAAYTFVSLNDTAFFCLSNHYCTETDFVCTDYEDLRDDNSTCYLASTEYSEGIKAEMGYEESNYGKYRFVDSTGRALTRFVLGCVSDFKNGYAIVTDKTDGEVYMDVPFMRLYNMGDYHIDERGHKTGNNYSLMDRQGRTTIAMKRYDVLAGYVSEGMLPACKGGKWGYVSPQGTVKIALKYEGARPFGEGLAAVKQDGKWGYVDTKGTLVIPCRFDKAYIFRHGVGVVEQVVNGITMCGLVDREGRCTFDYLAGDSLGGIELKHHEGPFGSDGQIKYSYYERDGQQVRHGYYAFHSPTLREDGHYRDGRKEGLWVQEYHKFENDDNYQPFHHDNGYADRLVAVDYVNGVAQGDFHLFTHTMIDDMYDLNHNLTGTAQDGKAVEKIDLQYNPLQLDDEGNLHTTAQMGNYDPSGETFKEVNLEITFAHGVPVQVVEVNQYNYEKRNTLYRHGVLTAQTVIRDTTVGKEERHYKIIGGEIYSLEPMTAEAAHRLFNFGAYSRYLQQDLEWLFTLPASWQVPDVEGPKVNQLRRVPTSELMDLTYDQYGDLYESRDAFEQAYRLGHSGFLASVAQKRIEKKEKSQRMYGYLFCTGDEFELNYSYGDERFEAEVARRVRIYNNEFTPEKDWFTDFCEYQLYHSMGSDQLVHELSKRKELYETHKGSFANIGDFLGYYKLGEEALTTESTKRAAMFAMSKDPFNDSMLYADMATFLTYYTQGNLEQENERRREATKQQYKELYGSHFLSDRDFDSYYVLGRRLFLQEAVTRQFAAGLEEYKSLKLKQGLTSDKDAVMAYFHTVTDCKRRSAEAYPKIVRLMLENNKGMAKEWKKNGKHFDDEIQFYEAYIAGNYKEILKERKRK